MTDQDEANAIRLDEDSLRRHWRSMGLVAAWRAVIAMYVSDWLLYRAFRVLAPYTSKRTHAAFDVIWEQLGRDYEVGDEGLTEAKALALKQWQRRRLP